MRLPRASRPTQLAVSFCAQGKKKVRRNIPAGSSAPSAPSRSLSLIPVHSLQSRAGAVTRADSDSTNDELTVTAQTRADSTNDEFGWRHLWPRGCDAPSSFDPRRVRPVAGNTSQVRNTGSPLPGGRNAPSCRTPRIWFSTALKPNYHECQNTN